MKKNLSLFLLALIITGCPSPEKIETKTITTIHFKKPTLWGSEVYIYSWKSGGENTPAFPGNPMTYEGNGWYTASVSAPTATIDLLFNDRAGAQTVNLNRTGEGWYFTDDTWYDANPDPTGTTPPVLTVGQLKITEIGSGYNYYDTSSWIEVYNSSSTESTQLSQYTLKTYGLNRTNGTQFGIYDFSLPELVIAPQTYALVRGKPYGDFNTGARVAYILKDANTIPYWHMDGFVELLLAGNTVDFARFGVATNTPTTSGQWSGASATALPNRSYGQSLSRNLSLTDTDANSDWTLTNFSTPGGPNDVGPGATDLDSDGIPNEVKASGQTLAGMNLFGWGAIDNTKRDIFIHLDYMDSSDPGVTPQKAALDMVVAAFAAKNIRIHFDVGDLYLETPGTGYNLSGTSHKRPFSAGLTLGNTPNRANLYNYKNNYMPLERRQVFHYLLFGYSQDPAVTGGSSGLAEIKGNDLLVTLGTWGLKTTADAYGNATENTNILINIQASTIMHELGHNLGLQHGGNVETNYKPNYFSIMNYLYQIDGLSTIGTNEGDRYYRYRYYQVDNKSASSVFLPLISALTNSYKTTNFKMDYSNGLGGTLIESNLNESLGLRRTGSTPVNFNGGTASELGVSIDLNNDGSLGSLVDYDDWGNLYLNFRLEWSGDTNGVSLYPTSNSRDILIDDKQDVIVETMTRDLAFGPK